MKTKVAIIKNLNEDKDFINEAGNIIKSGGTVAFPTETVYGIGTNGLDENAVKKLYKVKQRPLNKPISLLVNNMNKQVDLAYASNNNNLVTNCLDELKYYDVTKYQQEYLHWKKLLTTAKENLDNGLISHDMMEKNNAYKQMVYTEGEYIIGVDILPGEYVVVKNDGIEKGRVFLEHQEDVSSNTIINASGDDFIGKKIVLNGTTMYHIDNSEQIKSKNHKYF